MADDPRIERAGELARSAVTVALADPDHRLVLAEASGIREALEDPDPFMRALIVGRLARMAAAFLTFAAQTSGASPNELWRHVSALIGGWDAEGAPDASPGP